MTQELVEAVRAAGVVGAGGAGFPTHVKLASQVDTVIANGVECDPLLQCDQRLMESRAREMVRGVQLAMQATGAKQGVLALKREIWRRRGCHPKSYPAPRGILGIEPASYG